MVTNYPQDIVAQGVGTTTVDIDAGRAFSRLWKRVQYALCSLHGHDPLLHFDHNRMYLQCASCGHETPGWELNDHRPRLRFHGNPQHHFVRQSVSTDERERRIA
jgi:hypothetical protein